MLLNYTKSFYFLGGIFESWSDLSVSNNSFVVQNILVEVIVYINGEGDMFMNGSISVDDSLSGITTGDLEFRNSTDSLVSFFDGSGNLKLEGGYSTNYIGL